MEEWRKGGRRELEEEGGRERTLWRNGKTGRGSGEDTGKGDGGQRAPDGDRGQAPPRWPTRGSDGLIRAVIISILVPLKALHSKNGLHRDSF